MDPKNAIEVRNMSKSFKVNRDKANTLKTKLLYWGKNKVEIHEVLKNINLNIQKGETVALIGTNGSGKSTLLKLMTKIIYPNSGTLETDGKLTSLLELGAGFHPDFTGRENIYFNASIFGLTKSEIDARINDIIEFSELGSAIDDPIRTYSSGMYMRLAFSVAINVDADILLVDEILAVGDQHFQDKCFAKLEELRDSNKTIVIVSHSLDTVRKLCTRAIWIYKGELKLDGDPTYVIREYVKKCADDQREEREREIKEGKRQTKGVLFIDWPKDLSDFKKVDFPVEARGWQVSDALNPKLSIKFNGKELEIDSYQRRIDVYTAYMEMYPDLDKEKIGWKVMLQPEDVIPGENKLNVSLYDGDRQLACIEHTIEIEEEA